MTSSVDVDNGGSSFSVTWPDGGITRFNRFWLRDNCPSDGDRASLFRDVSVAELPDDLRITAAECSGDVITVSFSDGKTDVFDPSWLRAQSSPRSASSARPWRADHQLATFDTPPERASADHLGLLEALAQSGVAVMRGLASDGLEGLAALLGHIRHTDFGRVFDIIVEPDPFTPSQSPSALDPHTDDPYRYTPSGISILHCVEPSSGEGGASTVVDGFAVAEALAEADPDGFELLSTVAVPFMHHRADAVDQGDDVHLRAEAPIIAVTSDGTIAGIRFHERSMAPLRLADADLTDRFYRALMRFTRMVRDPAFQWQHKLAAGEAIVYDNQRVLHGRTGFAGSQTRRHIRLCTVDRDQVHSRLRRLREQHDTGTETDPLPPGNLS